MRTVHREAKKLSICRSIASMDKLRRETEESDALKKKKQLEDAPDNPSFGYGGKFGVQKDRMDASAVGHEYVGKVEKHASQKDYSTGFGGKFGVQTDRVDKVLYFLHSDIFYAEINNSILIECCKLGPQGKTGETCFPKGLHHGFRW